MDTCEILIVVLLFLLVIIMAVVPLAIVMTIVELLNKRKMEIQQRNRVGSRRNLNSVSMSTLQVRRLQEIEVRWQSNIRKTDRHT